MDLLLLQDVVDISTKLPAVKRLRRQVVKPQEVTEVRYKVTMGSYG